MVRRVRQRQQGRRRQQRRRPPRRQRRRPPRRQQRHLLHRQQRRREHRQQRHLRQQSLQPPPHHPGSARSIRPSRPCCRASTPICRRIRTSTRSRDSCPAATSR